LLASIGGALAYPKYLECNTTRLVPGATIMGHTNEQGSASDVAISISDYDVTISTGSGFGDGTLLAVQVPNNSVQKVGCSWLEQQCDDQVITPGKDAINRSDDSTSCVITYARTIDHVNVGYVNDDAQNGKPTVRILNVRA
jgi:hypothetical protein